LIHPTPPNFQNSGCPVVNDEFHYHSIPVFLNDVNGKSSERQEKLVKTKINIDTMP
jgi:hypothetical protein